MLGITKEKTRERSTRLAVFALFTAPFLVGSVLLYQGWIKPLWGNWQSRDWEEVTCQILASRLVAGEPAPDFEALDRLAISYRYTYRGQQHTSQQVNFIGLAAGEKQREIRETLRRLPPGSTTTCLVNPQDPREAVLRRETLSLAGSLMALVPTVCGLGGMIASLWSFRARKPPRVPQQLLDTADADSPLAAVERVTETRFVEWAPGRRVHLHRPGQSTAWIAAAAMAFVLSAIFCGFPALIVGVVAVHLLGGELPKQSQMPDACLLCCFVMGTLGAAATAVYFWVRPPS